ncbi:Hpt domain-containing protein [Methylosinus sp. Ce-a6]|uniref:Hpt domain-containing protein n=1 Tax=Methylosinus sp. Ce-a6 TaxID=2172005 RepID=UPI00135AEFCD|nr:Hpt domain-containing protein [Methylosinus sp. Ce-a6]
MTERKNPDSSEGSPEASGPAIDWAYLARQTMDDVELERELLALFTTQAGAFGGRLAAAAGADKERRDLAHTLKGAARAIGAFSLGQAAEEYESAVATVEAPDRLRALDARLLETQQAIAARLAQG